MSFTSTTTTDKFYVGRKSDGEKWLFSEDYDTEWEAWARKNDGGMGDDYENYTVFRRTSVVTVQEVPA